MKLLFCIKALGNQAGGAERVFVDIVNGLKQQGHEVCILTYDGEGTKSFYTLDHSIKWHQLGIGSADRPASVTATLFRMKKLRQIAVSERPDIVVGFMHSMFIPLGIALSGTGIPVVASEHIVPKHYQSRFLERYLLYLSPIFLKKLTCVSTQVRELYPPFIRRKMVPISNPVSLKAGVRGHGGELSRKRKVILSIGRLDQQKDHITLIKAYQKILDECPDWDLRIIGEGHLRSDLEHYIESNSLGERVQLPGNVKGIEGEYFKADIFVMSSLYESFGLALAEALSSGMPAIGFRDCPGVNQLIKPNENGFLVNSGPDRVAALSQAMLYLIENEGLRIRYSQSAIENSKSYSLENVLSKWQELFQSLAEAK